MRVVPATLHRAEGRIYIDILTYNLAQKNCCYRPEWSINQSVRFGGNQDSLIGLKVFRVGRYEFRRPQEWITSPPTNSDKGRWDFMILGWTS